MLPLIAETHSVCSRTKSSVFCATKFAAVYYNWQKVNLLITTNDMNIGDIRGFLELSLDLTDLRFAPFQFHWHQPDAAGSSDEDVVASCLILSNRCLRTVHIY